ncbi:hypothetical protein SUGI_0448050 [Cryptomeria japonica]|nr:hypothetical protein SUGI_0448050 [Cryptomeria japonica]
MSNKRRVTEIEGTVVLRKAAFLDVKDFTANAVDRFSEFMERKVLFQLASSEKIDNETGYGKVSPHKAELSWNTPSSEAIVTDTIHEITFYWPPEYGTPGAIVVKNRHAREFFLKHVSIRVPGQGVINFLCNSWVYPSWMARVCCNLQAERVFFANNSYLPEETSKGLRKWRREKLSILKGDGTGKREKWDRIYDYDVYNDLGDPDNDQRTTLGGSLDFPYPRRCRTGRNRIRINGMLGSILPESFSSGFYIPADQRLPHASRSDFLAHSLKALGRKYVTDSKLLKEDFGDLEEVKRLYSRGLSSTTDRTISLVKEAVPFQIVKRILDTEDQAILRFPRPNIISRDDNAWMKDEEFARQTLSGVNPMMIERVRRFPIFSNLNAQIYDPQKSSINAQQLHPYLDGFSVEV